MIDKRRYALARERSNNMLDRDDTIDKFLIDRFVEITLEQKETFHKLLQENLVQIKIKEKKYLPLYL